MKVTLEIEAELGDPVHRYMETRHIRKWRAWGLNGVIARFEAARLFASEIPRAQSDLLQKHARVGGKFHRHRVRDIHLMCQHLFQAVARLDGLRGIQSATKSSRATEAAAASMSGSLLAVSTRPGRSIMFSFVGTTSSPPATAQHFSRHLADR